MDVLKQIVARQKSYTSIDELKDVFSAAFKALGYHGFDAFSMKAGTISHAEQADNSLFVCDYGMEAITDYVRDGWLQMDPVVAEIARTTTPFNYVDFLQNCQINTSVKWQLRILKISNVKRAWCVPLSTVGYMRGMTVYMRGGSKKQFEATLGEIHLLCVHFMEAYTSLQNPAPEHIVSLGNVEVASIGQREADCLHWVARGKTNWEIGKILIISENTVRYHLKKAFATLGANSRSSAVSIAARAGIIEI